MTRIQVGKKTIALLENPDYEKWSDEELIRGQQMDKRGRFNGNLPKVIPLALLQELNRRNGSKAIHRLEQALLPAVEYLCKVAEGTIPGDQVDETRIRVCETLINRILGKQTERIVITSAQQNDYEKAGVQKAVVIRDVAETGVIDVESVEVDPFGQ